MSGASFLPLSRTFWKLAVASDQNDPSGVCVDVFAVCMPMLADGVDELAKGDTSANAPSVTFRLRPSVCITISGQQQRSRVVKNGAV